MKKLLIILGVILCFSPETIAQNNAIFSGGIADGTDTSCYKQAIPTTISYIGGTNDGYSKGCYTQNIPQSISFLGGINDGYAQDCYQQNIPLTVSYSGGINDGFSQDCYTQVSNLNAIFNGGIGGDGMLNGCANEPLGCMLAVNLSNDTSFCDGNSITLNPGAFSGSATYLWQDSSTTQTFLADTSGIYYVYVTDTGGCIGIDSITINVLTQPIVNLGNDTSFCVGSTLTLDAENPGATYLWQNNPTAPYQNQTLAVNATGIYFVTSSFGTCTDTDSINVNVNPIVTNSITDAVVCQGDSVLIFGNYQSIASTYYDTLVAATGCDSIVSQQLIVNPIYNSTLSNVTICQGDSALIFGNYHTTAGIYYDSLTTVNGCDSILSQTLNVSPIHNVNLGNDTSFCIGGTLTLDAGAGANSYLWQNNLTAPYQNQTLAVNATGTYFVATTLGACTTSDTILVTVNPVVTNSITDAVVCQGDSALIFGNYQSIASTYYDTLVATTGCDSIVSQQLIVNPIYNSTLSNVTICQGDSALIFGNYHTTAGIYYDSLTTVNGCDSILQTTLLINPTYAMNTTASICSGDSIYLENTYQTIAGIYSDTLPSINGCDSIVLTTLTINPTFITNLNVAICQGDSLFVGGAFQNSAGIYTDVLSTVSGCDSTINTTINVNPIVSNSLSPLTICENDSAFIFGNYQFLAGIYDSLIPNGSVNGCDSIVYQQLIINPIYAISDVANICQGDSILLGGSYQTTAGAYIDNLQTVNGCDSIITTTLVINPVYTNSITVEICEGDSLFVSGAYQTINGIYSDTLQAITSCDSIILTTLVVKPLPVVSITASSTEINAG
ncbi:MAG TPA: hypothetical protein EYG86_02635, partial [Crocinitomicaceae bacterium]|nr:hypothetical protein [Crocinitomicaceae bacterium]